MAKFRIYPSQNTTLIEGSEVNTGLNEVMELWYGVDGVSRFLIKFDYSDYMDRYNEGLVPHITGTSATFNMTILPFTYEDTEYSVAQKATDVDLIVKTVGQNWSEGIGHDFVGVDTIYDEANWYSATTISNWASEGGDYVYEVASGHVGNADTNLSIPISDEVALWETFTGSNYGLAVSYTSAYEGQTGDIKSVLKYYTRHSHTYNHPYMELEWDNQITDQRDELIAGTTKRIYLYTKKDGTFQNVDDINSVSFTFENPTVSVSPITTIHNPMVGIYYVDFVIPANAVGSDFTDVWNVRYESTLDYTTVSQTGTINVASDVWDSSSVDVIDPKQMSISIPTLQEVYTRGDMVYLDVNALQKWTSNTFVLKDMTYSIHLEDGTLKIPFVEDGDVSYTTDSNFIVIDTTWLKENNFYRLSFEYITDGTTFSETFGRKFKILGDS